MAAGDVARFVRDDADYLVRRIGLLQGAGVNEHVAAIEHKGVEGVALDDADGDAALAEPCCLEDRPRVIVEQLLDLGIADQALGSCLLHCCQQRESP